MAELLATQNQLMQSMITMFGTGGPGARVAATRPPGGAAPAGRNPPNYGEFMRTKPLAFAETVEPLDAEDWLRAVEKKMELIRSSEGDKVRFATSLLEGTANDWWETYKESREEGEPEPDWKEFTDAFREAYIPTAIMKMKRDQFRALTQGDLSVQEYLNRFTQLARYATQDLPDEEVDNKIVDANRKRKFAALKNKQQQQGQRHRVNTGPVWRPVYSGPVCPTTAPQHLRPSPTLDSSLLPLPFLPRGSFTPAASIVGYRSLCTGMPPTESLSISLRVANHYSPWDYNPGRTKGGPADPCADEDDDPPGERPRESCYRRRGSGRPGSTPRYVLH